MYGHLINNNIKVTQEIWHMKIPLKIKISMWYLKREVILTTTGMVVVFAAFVIKLNNPIFVL